MKILAHRGKWNKASEKNSLDAFLNAFNSCYGIETDFRDYCGKLVISHDVADQYSLEVETLFEVYAEKNINSWLAINIKADGIQGLLSNSIKKFNLKNYFLFDMSIPEMVSYNKAGLNFFTRQSDLEKEPVLYDQCMGIWLDEWNKNWINYEILDWHLMNGKMIGIISPEIHERDNVQLWTMLKKYNAEDKVLLCTDLPQQAEEYFKA